MTDHDVPPSPWPRLEWAIMEFWGFKANLFVDIELRKMYQKIDKIELLVHFLRFMSQKFIRKSRTSLIGPSSLSAHRERKEKMCQSRVDSEELKKSRTLMEIFNLHYI